MPFSIFNVKMKRRNKTRDSLWTRDFTIITVGSVISMFGNSLSGFAMSLLVLDYTDSSMLYALYIVMFTLPQVIMPIVSGPLLDRFSRKKTIYILDFISAGMYLAVGALLSRGWFSFPLFAVYIFIVGSIQSIYYVAFDSFYPLLITEGYFQRAYSIASVLETLSNVMVPVSAIIYRTLGIAPLLMINALCFFGAAVMETRIKAQEEYIETQKSHVTGATAASRWFGDLKEGLYYLWSEKGLLAIAVYFTFSAISNGAASVLTLPYFRHTFDNGEFTYMIVWGMAVAGRAIGGMIHYKFRIPAQYRYAIALSVYIILSVSEGFYLYFPIIVMQICCFMSGFLGVTSYTIRISATQRYVPDEKKGRFNGAFVMLNQVGMLLAEVLAGALGGVFDPRHVITGFMLVNGLAAVVFIGGGKKEISSIYNVSE